MSMSSAVRPTPTLQLRLVHRAELELNLQIAQAYGHKLVSPCHHTPCHAMPQHSVPLTHPSDLTMQAVRALSSSLSAGLPSGGGASVSPVPSPVSERGSPPPALPPPQQQQQQQQASAASGVPVVQYVEFKRGAPFVPPAVFGHGVEVGGSGLT
jgi:hypothetical protein